MRLFDLILDHDAKEYLTIKINFIDYVIVRLNESCVLLKLDMKNYHDTPKDMVIDKKFKVYEFEEIEKACENFIDEANIFMAKTYGIIFDYFNILAKKIKDKYIEIIIDYDCYAYEKNLIDDNEIKMNDNEIKMNDYIKKLIMYKDNIKICLEYKIDKNIYITAENTLNENEIKLSKNYFSLEESNDIIDYIKTIE
jgi:hypothetical protein